jgi:predicted nuclease with TOPRIM domain
LAQFTGGIDISFPKVASEATFAFTRVLIPVTSDVSDISNHFSTLLAENADLASRILSLEHALRSLAASIFGSPPLECESAEHPEFSFDISRISSTLNSLRELNALRRSRIADLESALRSLRSTIVGSDEMDLIDPISDVSDISSVVSSLRSRVSDLKSALESLRSTIVGIGETDSIDPTSDVSDILSIVSSLRAENATQRSRIAEMESALESLQASVRSLELKCSSFESDLHSVKQSFAQSQAAWDAERSALLSQGEAERQTAATAISESLRSIARLVNFSEVCQIAFTDLTSLASTDSYLSRLLERIRVVCSAALRLKKGLTVQHEEKIRLEAKYAELQQTHEPIVSERDALKEKLQKATALNVRFRDSLSKLDGKYKALNQSHQDLVKDHQAQTASYQDLTARYDELKKAEADVVRRLHFLLPSLPDLVPPDAVFQLQVEQFLADYPRFLVSQALNRSELHFQMIHGKFEEFTGQFVRFNSRLVALLKFHVKLHQHYVRLTRTSKRRDASYMNTLVMLFPERMRPSDLGKETARIHDQLVMMRALLRSTFKLIPNFHMDLPDDLYQLALGLRRQLGATSCFQKPEDLFVDIDMRSIQEVDQSNSLLSTALNQHKQIRLILGKTVMLDTIVPPLASMLNQDLRSGTATDVIRMLAELRTKVDKANNLRARVVEFHNKIDKMTAEMGALPESVSNVIGQLKVDGA